MSRKRSRFGWDREDNWRDRRDEHHSHRSHKDDDRCDRRRRHGDDD